MLLIDKVYSLINRGLYFGIVTKVLSKIPVFSMKVSNELHNLLQRKSPFSVANALLGIQVYVFLIINNIKKASRM